MKAERFILLFLDGVGLGAPQAENPLANPTSMPWLQQFLGVPLLAGYSVHRDTLLFQPIDACLGVPGLPQSATGQTTLYTGQNAAQFLGRHQTGFANGRLRTLIEASGMFKQVLALGKTATLANAYSQMYFDAIATRRLRYSVCTLLNLTAGLPFRMEADYAQGEAIFWDITGDLAPARGLDSPPITAEVAGERLARLGSQHHLTLFESYLTDFAGHNQDYDQAIQVLQRVDAFIAHLITALTPEVTLVICSDHGNIEDVSTKHHTFNAVPLIVVGSGARQFATVQSLVGVTPCILHAMTAAVADEICLSNIT